MSIKIDSPRDAFNFVKEKCTSMASRVVTDPALAMKVVGATLGAVVVIVWLAIVLFKHRKARIAAAMSKPNLRTQRRRK